MKKTDKLAFILGAGISIPAKLPSTSVITEQILSGENIRRHTDCTYSFGKPLYSHIGQPDEYVPRIVIFLNRLKIEIDLYYFDEFDRVTNYEDIYYVANQIYDSELREYDNPVVQAFINNIESDINPLLIRRNSFETKDKMELHELAGEATHYIRDVVWSLLNKKPERLDHLSCIRDACLDDDINKVDIYTLNHDTLLEQFFAQAGVNMIDGFSKPIKKVRYWKPTVYRHKSQVRYFKLHGSINWFHFRSVGGDWSNDFIGIPLEWDFWHTKGKDGKRQMPTDGRPMFLAGTFNKMLDYTRGIYSELYFQFHNSIKLFNKLVAYN